MSVLSTCFLFVFAAVAISASAALPSSGSVAFPGAAVVEVKGDAGSGLGSVYVVESSASADCVEVRMEGDGPAKWMVYSEMGGGYARPVEGAEQDGDVSRLRNFEANRGYIVSRGTRQISFWITDYSSAPLTLNGLAATSDCSRTVLEIEGECAPIYYTGLNGRRFALPRELELTYRQEVWSEAAGMYVPEERRELCEASDGRIVLSPGAYCSTVYTLSGDRFLRAWGGAASVSTDVALPAAVAVNAKAFREDGSELEAEEIWETDAPATVRFDGFGTEAMAHAEWQISLSEDFNEPEWRFNEQGIEHTFREAERYYVRFVGSDSRGECRAESPVFIIETGESSLKVPNAFVPGSAGRLAVWRVTSSSLQDFDCHIFNRYGIELFHTTDPAQGWDGIHKGKPVRPGVYFYVIVATGADGKKYRKSGDINVLKEGESQILD